MNKIVKVITASVLTVSMCGCAVSADEAKSTATADTVSSEKKSSKKDASEAYTSQQTGKDETVYVFTGADGSMNHMVVSDTLHTAGKKGAVEDYSNLDNIENVSGDEKYSSDGNGNITWTSDGTDISYQGTTDKELPVDVKITYYLNGNEVSPEEIKGQSGHVKVHFDYTNNAETTITSDGKEKTVKVPFGMVTGLTLDASKFTNVTVTNGKMNQYNDSDVIYGLALPGLKESLETASVSDIDLTSVNIPEYFEFEADTTDFDIDLCMTIATSNLLSLLNTDDLNVSDFSDSIDQLTSSGQKLVDGTKSLKDGTSQLKSGADSLDSGAQSLVNGIGTLNDGASSLNDGAASLASGAQSLNDGAKSVNDGASSLASGAQSLSEGANTVNDGANSLASGAQSLASGASQLDSGIASAYSGASTISAGLSTASSKSAALRKGAQDITNSILETVNAQLAAAGQATYTWEYIDQHTNADVDLTKYYGTAIKKVADNQNVADLAQATGIDSTTIAKAMLYLVATNGTAPEDGWTEESIEATAGSSEFNQMLVPLTALISSGKKLSDTGNQNLAAIETELNNSNAEAVLQKLSDIVNATVSKTLTNNTGLASTLSNVITVYVLNQNGVSSIDAFGKVAGGAISENTLLVLTALNAASANSDPTINGILASLVSNSSEYKDAFGKLDAVYQNLVYVRAFYTGVVDYTDGVDKLAAGAKQLTSGLETLKAGSSSLNTGAQTLLTGANTLAAGTKSLADGAGTLLNGSNTLASGTQTLYNGTGSLLTGSNSLRDGAAELFSGVGKIKAGAQTLKNGTSSLKTGVVTLDEGAATLESGMEQFYEEGIKKIGDVLGKDLPAVVDSLKGLTNAGADYKTFSGALDDSNNSCKFIFKTEFDSDNK